MYWVYILASGKHGALYIGVTNDLVRRVYEHRNKIVRGFTSRYGVARLAWFETYDDPTSAIEREKELKKWRREWKVNLVERDNPNWDDLYNEITRSDCGYGFRARASRAPE
jgi:putative endonuclease